MGVCDCIVCRLKTMPNYIVFTQVIQVMECELVDRANKYN